MEVRGEHRFGAPRAAVWAALHDPAALQAAIPGCDALTEVAPDCYDVALTFGLATVSGSFAGNITIEDIEPGRALRVLATGGGSGPLSGRISASLADDREGTHLSYIAELDAPGAAGRLGGPLIGGAVKMIAARFLEAIDAKVDPAPD